MSKNLGISLKSLEEKIAKNPFGLGFVLLSI